MSEEELGVPIDNNSKRKSERFIPRFFRSDSNKKFLSSTVDNLIQNGTVRRLNGYIGRQNSKATTGSDVFLEEPLKERQDYQLETSLIGEDNLGNVNFFKDSRFFKVITKIITFPSFFRTSHENIPRLIVWPSLLSVSLVSFLGLIPLFIPGRMDPVSCLKKSIYQNPISCGI